MGTAVHHLPRRSCEPPHAHTHAGTCPSAGPWDHLPPAEGRPVLVTLETGSRAVPTRCAPESRPQAHAPSGAQVLHPTPSPQGACLCLTAGSALGFVGGCSPFPCRCLTSHPSAAMHGRRLYPALHPAPCPGGQTQAGGPCPRGAPSQSPGPGIHACPSSLSAARRWPLARRPRGNPGSPAVGTQVLAVP